MRRFLSSVISRHFRVEGVTVADRRARSRQVVSLLDFGSDTVKAAVVQRAGKDVRVLGYGFASARECDLSGGRTAVDTLAAAADEALVAAEDRSTLSEGQKVVPDDAIFCVPPRLTCGQSFAIRQTRQDRRSPITAREMKTAWERLERMARERFSSPDKEEVLWKPLTLTPNAVMVDGHPVADPVGLNGNVISVSAFGAAVLPSVLRAVEAVAKRLEVALVDVMAGPQSLATLSPHREAILIDVGWGGTSLSLIRYDALVATRWWPQGGDFFTRSLADAFYCSPDRAEALKRAYIGGILSAEDTKLVNQALVKPVGSWFSALLSDLVHLAAEDAMAYATPLRTSVSPLSRRDTDVRGEKQGTTTDSAVAYTPDHSADPMELTVGAGEMVVSDADDTLPGRIYITGGGSLLPDLVVALSGIEATSMLRFRRVVEVES